MYQKGIRALDPREIVSGARRSRMFDRAFAEFERQPWHALNAGNHVIERLITGWGNEVWSAGADFLREILKETARGTGPILECGSGLTTARIGSRGSCQRAGNRQPRA